MANLIIQENGVTRTRSATHGEEITIKSPCDCSSVTGVQINGVVFPFYDVTGHSLANINELFSKDSLIRVLIDTDLKRSYILNADTNSYLERRFDELSNSKVDKIDGKGLSSNDFTNDEKTKLSGISDSADSVEFTPSETSGNKVGTIKINGVETDMYSPEQTSVVGNAGTATKLETSRTIALSGDVAGEGTFDGSADLNISTTIPDRHRIWTKAIPSGADLNDYKTPGFYRSEMGNDAVSNTPSGFTGGFELEVKSIWQRSNSYCSQLIRRFDSTKMYIRWYSVDFDSWSAWDGISIDSEKYKISPQVIPTNSDLNAYTTPGFYYSRSAGNIISNIPSTFNGSFELIVTSSDMSSTAKYCSQIIKTYKSNEMYVRTNYNGTWSSWGRILTHILNSNDYGTSLPTAGTAGRIFFKKA